MKRSGVYFLRWRGFFELTWREQSDENAILDWLCAGACGDCSVFWAIAARARTGAIDGYLARRNCRIGIATGFPGRRAHSGKGRKCSGRGDRNECGDGRGRANDEWNRRRRVCDRLRRESEQTLRVKREWLGAEGTDD